MKKILLSTLISFSIVASSYGQVPADTLKASKLAKKAEKLYASGKDKKISQAIDLYKQAGSMGLPSACRFLADYYMKITPPDVESSIHWTEILGDMGDNQSLEKLVEIYSGKMSSYGYPEDSDIPKLTEWSKALALTGNLKGIESAGACYLVSGDTTQALGWFEKGAELGSETSMVTLSRLYSLPGSNNVPESAFKYAEKASEQGNMECTYMLGKMYMAGYGCTQDYSKAYSYFEKCKDEPFDDIPISMAYCRTELNDGKMDDSTIQLLQTAADKGNVDAMRVLGDSYANGNGVSSDLSKALEWYEKAALQNDPYSLYATSMILLTGKETSQEDKAKAISYLEKAAANGYASAQNDLAMLYLNGQFVDKDVKKGIELLEKASESGNPYSMSTLSSIYYQGELVGKDETKALKLQQEAAASGLPESQFNTGYLYLNKIGTSGLKSEERLVTEDLVKQDKDSTNGLTDEQIAIYWMRKASENGHPLAQQNLAYMILNGVALGTESEAVSLLQKSADQGISESLYTLGSLYFNGKAGLAKNPKKGVEYVQKAADQGHIQAQMEMGMIYISGDKASGITQNVKKGLEYFKKSADNGNVDAQLQLGLLYLNGAPSAGISQNVKSGFKYVKQAADQGLPAAMYYTAVCYFQGAGTTVNKSEAKKWMTKASTQTMDSETQKAAIEALKSM